MILAASAVGKVGCAGISVETIKNRQAAWRFLVLDKFSFLFRRGLRLAELALNFVQQVFCLIEKLSGLVQKLLLARLIRVRPDQTKLRQLISAGRLADSRCLDKTRLSLDALEDFRMIRPERFRCLGLFASPNHLLDKPLIQLKKF